MLVTLGVGFIDTRFWFNFVCKGGEYLLVAETPLCLLDYFLEGDWKQNWIGQTDR